MFYYPEPEAITLFRWQFTVLEPQTLKALSLKLFVVINNDRDGT